MTYRRAVLNALLMVTEKGAFANLAAKEAFSDVRPKDLGRSTALLYTCIEHLNYCDHLIESFAKGRLNASVRGILRLGIAEMFFMDTPDHAVCNESVKLAAEIGKAQLKGYVNGVLRGIARARQNGELPKLPDDIVERLVIETGYPDFFIREQMERFGVEFAEAMLKAEADDTCVRAVYPETIDAVKAHLSEKGIAFKQSLLPDAVMAESVSGIADDELFENGRMTVQSIGAMLACRCLAPKPGDTVLDCCAAPGGKTAYLFDLMGRKGSIAAWDIHPHRVGLINSTLKRLGIPYLTFDNAEEQLARCLSDEDGNAVYTSVNDASAPCAGYGERFDEVLCDVPCSGLAGGSKPDARYRRKDADIASLAELQLAILVSASGYLKPGGALLYSTCTVSLRENEQVVERFLCEHKDFRLDSLSPFLPELLKERGENGMLTLFPNVDGTEGFFIARLVKKPCDPDID